MKSPVKVSVIVVNYNWKEYRQRCLLYVLDNDFKDYEIIIVDNGSTDGSVSLIQKKFVNHFLEHLKLRKDTSLNTTILKKHYRE